MRIWKQLVISLTIVAAAFLAWAVFHPGAGPVLGPYGLDWLAVSSTSREEAGAGQNSSSGGGGGSGGNRETIVVTAPVAEATVNDRLTAIGTGQAARTVAVRPLVDGQIAEIAVTSGTQVEAGDVMIRLDSEEQELAVERARLTLADAERKVERTASLLARRATTAVEADTARSEENAARVALREAELALSRRTVKAPIAGSIGILAVSEGDYVTTQSDITTIDDRSEILVEFFVPERFIARVEPGRPVTAAPIARPGEKFEGEVMAIDNRVDEASRTLRVRARIPNPDELLRAGMAFEVTMRFDGDTYPSVDPLAIQWDSQGAYVWLVKDSRAERLGVEIVQRNADRVLVSGPLVAGETVVTEGVQDVRAGAPVRIAGEESPPAANGDDATARNQAPAS